MKKNKIIRVGLILVIIMQLFALPVQAEELTAVPLYYVSTTHSLEYIYTTSWQDIESLKASGYIYSGIFCYVSPVKKPGLVPLYHMHNSNIGDHLSV